MKIKTPTMRQCFEAGVHLGHRACYWNPAMAPYIYGKRDGLHLINLDKTLPLFHVALQRVATVAAKGGRILFVGTKSVASEAVRLGALHCNMFYVDNTWLGGNLTNFQTIRKSIKKLDRLEGWLSDEAYMAGITKKEGLRIRREVAKLTRSLGGIRNMGGLPDLVFIIDVGKEKIALQECIKLSIPVVAVVDTNYAPDGVNYIIPGNDDSIRSIQLYTSYVSDAILTARKQAKLEGAGASREKKGRAASKGEEAAKRVVKRISATKTQIVNKSEKSKTEAGDLSTAQAIPESENPGTGASRTARPAVAVGAAQQQHASESTDDAVSPSTGADAVSGVESGKQKEEE